MSREDEVIEELVSLVLMQHEEIEILRKKVEQVKRYIEVYEDYIQRGQY